MNNTLSFRGYFIVFISLLFAFLLSTIPLPNWAILLRPQWVVLVLIYWVIALPHRVSLGIAWILGLLLDALHGTVLGEHALALVAVVYLVEKFYRQMRMSPWFQQALSVFVLLMIYQGLLFWIQGVLGQLPSAKWFWVPALTSMVIWPWLFMLLRGFRQQFMMY